MTSEHEFFATARERQNILLKRAYDRVKASRSKKRRISNTMPRLIAVLDMETDPFDAAAREIIHPFMCDIYAPEFGHIVIFDNDHDVFISRVIEAIERLPNKYVIYAHNGGKFDYMFLLSKLKGKVMFKGRAIMVASIGRHEIRDSLHLIPTALKNYKKDAFDYSLLHLTKRNDHLSTIESYIKSDCEYLYDLVSTFINRYGLAISIGAVSFKLLKAKYPKMATLSESKDAALRPFFFGGRVECRKGIGIFDRPMKLYDVNSMYPAVMAHYTHPIGSSYVSRNGSPSKDTVFVTVSCFSKGAFALRTDEGLRFPHCQGVFNVSIHEFNTANDLGLLQNTKIITCIDNDLITNFQDFVLPLYHERQETKVKLGNSLPNTPEHDELKKNDMFIKFFLNNAYGKNAQNPRKFSEYY